MILDLHKHFLCWVANYSGGYLVIGNDNRQKFKRLLTTELSEKNIKYKKAYWFKTKKKER